MCNPRDAVRAKLISSGIIGDDAYVVIAGPANTYAHYVATREEYSVQRYEGASTIFGPCKPSKLPFRSRFPITFLRYPRVVHRQVHKPRTIPGCGTLANSTIRPSSTRPDRKSNLTSGLQPSQSPIVTIHLFIASDWCSI